MAKKSFEENMGKLSEIAGQLERGGVSLENSLRLYKDAVKTVKLLKNELETAEGAVVIMKKDLDGVFTEDEVFKDEL